MKVFNRATGRTAENIAARFLRDKGYTILEQNFGNKYGEIDIIAQQKNVLVFVEVKAKTGVDFGIPEEMVSPQKLKRIRAMGMVYMKEKPVSCRVDVVAVVLGEDEEIVRITHYENVY